MDAAIPRVDMIDVLERLERAGQRISTLEGLLREARTALLQTLPRLWIENSGLVDRIDTALSTEGEAGE
jgi:hypothetical protein